MTIVESNADGSFDISATDMADEASAEELKEQGNACFKQRQFAQACEFYTRALAKDRKNHLLYSNRAAAFCLLQKYKKAKKDANHAIQLAPSWAKGYLRKAAACEGLEQWDDAIAAHRQLIALEPDSIDAKKALVRIKTLEKKTKRPEAAVKKGFLSHTTTQIYENDDDGSERAPDPTERKWKVMLRRLKEGCGKSGRNAKGERVVLDDGVFAKLLQQHEFQKLIYPGIPPDQLAHAPNNLQELLEDPWYEDELIALMPKVHAKAESVLTNVKKKGAMQGEIMDPATEAMLWPQVLQEAFAREVLAMVHRINYKKHALLAQDERTIADPNAECASWDQLPDEFLNELLVKTPQTTQKLDGVAVLDEFMGDEWQPLLWNDVQRMIKNGLLMAMDDQNRSGRMRFLDQANCQPAYPALAELLEKLQALPHEINHKRPDHATLCAQFARAMLLTQLKSDETQPWRLDCGTGDKDNGFKLTCVYCFHTDTSRRVELRTSLEDNAAVQRMDTVADRLIIFKSQHVYNSITSSSSSDDLVYLTFWIHGKHLA